MTNYKSDLNQRYWEYQKSQFPDWKSFFERADASDGRPPVFLSREAWRNVIVDPQANQSEIEELLELIPTASRHKWFRSMNSSQALAQSVLGNLAVHGHLDCLNDLQCDEGESFLGRAEVTSDNFAMEREVKHLGEPRPTSFDGYIDGDYRVGIECKFTESEVGTCSRPRLMPKASNFAKEHCDGNYSNKALGRERCPLTEIGVLYWRYIPSLFKWQNNIDMIPCPLKKNYQLARNILGVGVNAEGMVLPEDGHVVLIYDERNPAFQDRGDGFVAYWKTREALRVPGMLRRCSWQSIMQVMRRNEFLPWLMEQIDLKYRM